MDKPVPSVNDFITSFNSKPVLQTLKFGCVYRVILKLSPLRIRCNISGWSLNWIPFRIVAWYAEIRSATLSTPAADGNLLPNPHIFFCNLACEISYKIFQCLNSTRRYLQTVQYSPLKPASPLQSLNILQTIHFLDQYDVENSLEFTISL